MLRQIKQRLTAILEVENPASDWEHIPDTASAAAALLIEAARSDKHFDDVELEQIERSLETVFQIDSDQIKQTLETAQQGLDHATCLHEITSIINSNWDASAKISLIEAMWKVVLADQRIDPNEKHLMRKIKGLLHIPQSEYIAAKLRAKSSIESSQFQ